MEKLHNPVSDMTNEKQLARFENCLSAEGLKRYKENRKWLFQMKNPPLELGIDTYRAYEASTSQLVAIPDAVTLYKFITSKPKFAFVQYKPNVNSVESNIKC